MAYSKKNDTFQKAPGGGWKNPFYRDSEKHFDGGDLTIMSNVNSVFDEGFVSKSDNVMEKTLREQVPGHSKKSVNKGAKK